MAVAGYKRGMSAIAMGAALLAGATPAQRPKSSARATFEATCAACHGLDGKGGERGPNVATRPEVVRLSDADLQRILSDGIPSAGMPSFASIGKVKLAGLVGYLRELQGRGTNSALEGNPANGQKVFYGAGGCAECHLIQGKGGFIASDLSTFGTGQSAAEIRAAITTAPPDSRQSQALVTVHPGTGAAVEGIVRNEDNFSLQVQSLDGTFHFFYKANVASVERHEEPLMPTEYGTTLSKTQLNDLIAFLLSSARQPKAATNLQDRDED